MPFLGKVSHASICRFNTKCVLNFDEHVQGYIWIRPRRDDTCIKINPHEDYYVYAGAIAATISGRPDVDNMKFTKMLKDGYLKQAFNGPDFSTINMVLYATDKTLNKALGSSSKSSLINFGVDKMNSNIVDQFMGELKKLTTKLIDSDYHSQFVEIITTSNSVCP